MSRKGETMETGVVVLGALLLGVLLLAAREVVCRWLENRRQRETSAAFDRLNHVLWERAAKLAKDRSKRHH